MRKAIIILLSLFNLCVNAMAEENTSLQMDNITGIWKCSDLTLRNLGIDYDKMSGKIELKADSTFTMTAKGRGIGGHNF